MIEPRIMGTMTLKKSWRSVAPSRRAASMISVETPLMAADSTTIAKPVWSQIMITISAKMLSGFDVEPGDGLSAETGHDRVQQADLRLPGGCHAYTKLQMTDAPMSEMASGRKMNVLASASRRTRSNSPAMTRPRNTLPAGRHDQPDDVVAQDLDEIRRRHDRVVGEREVAVVVEEAAEEGRHGRVQQVCREQHEGRADKDPRQDAVAPSGSQQADEPADAEEQQPDAADADAERDRGKEELGKQLVALPLRSSVAPEPLPSGS